MVLSSPSPPLCLPLAAPAPGAGLAVLCEQVRQQWHLHVHAQAGRWRVYKLELFLGSVWTQPLRQAQAREGLKPSETPAALRQLVSQLQADVEERVVLASQPRLPSAELRLQWQAWHGSAPSRTAAPRSPLPVSAPLPSPVPSPVPAVSGVTAMSSKPNWFSRVFAAQDERAPAAEPTLEAKPLPAPKGKPLPEAMGQVAQRILAQERDMLDNLECRYAVRVLTFWVNTDSQPALRSLMEVNQKSPATAVKFVQTEFAKHCADAPKLLNTAQLRLEFKRDENLPRDQTEVLLVVGRETVVLPFAYTGEIDLGHTAPSAPPPSAGAAASTRSTQMAGAAASPAAMPGHRAVLVLWAQWPHSATLQRWRFNPAELGDTAAIWVGAEPGTEPNGMPAALPQHTLPTPDLSHISARHLKLVPPAHPGAGWQVVDTSTNGSTLFNPHDDAGERRLVKHQPQALPTSGALRLAPDSPSPLLLHFSQTLANPAAAVPGTVPMRPSRRVTEMTEPTPAGRGA